MSDAIRKQGNALENQFFQQVDQKLLDQLRQRQANASKREALASVANIQDPQVLDALLALDVDATTFAALSLVPLVAVAWADGTLDASERRAVLQAAEQNGVTAGQPVYAVLEKWLDQPIPAESVAAWRTYVAAVKKEADPATLAALRKEILDRAEKVAHASGGILGLVQTVSPAEKKMLAELAQAFDA